MPSRSIPSRFATRPQIDKSLQTIIGPAFHQQNWNLLINPATMYIVFSHRVPVHGKASERRCSHSPASSDNVVRGQAHDGLSF